MATYTTWNNSNVVLPSSWTRGNNTVRWYFSNTTTRYIQVLRGTYSGFSASIEWGDFNYVDFITITSNMYSYNSSRGQYYYDYNMDCSSWTNSYYYCQFMMSTSFSPGTVYCYTSNGGGEFYVSFGSTPTYDYSYAIKYGYGSQTYTNWYTDSDSSTSTYYVFNLPNYYPTRSGWVCKGFSTSVDGSVAYEKGDQLWLTSSSNTITLYCVWEEDITYYDHYLWKYSQGSLVDYQYTETTTVNTIMYIDSYTPTRSGYNFLGWDTSSSASTVRYENGDAVVVGSDFNLYAVWEQIIRYTYELEIVDGFGTTCDTFTNTTTATSQTWTVPSYSSSYPSHNGYVFKNWKYYQATYNPGNSITLYYNNPTGVLTAQWNVDTDTFYLQLGTITSSSITVRITGLTAKSYARTVEFVCNGVTKTVTVSANSTSSSYVTFTGLSSESGYEINATLKVGSLTLGSNYIDAYPLLNFAWTNVIAQGYPISNLTASDWNEYNRLLTIKAIRHNKTHSYTTVSTGTIIYATYYNAVCNSLRNINSNYNINNVASGDQVIATPFNTMVTYLNTDDN